jgi:hypothetical protein
MSCISHLAYLLLLSISNQERRNITRLENIKWKINLRNEDVWLRLAGNVTGGNKR